MLTNTQFTRYVELYIDTVFRVAYNYLHSSMEADDVTQNVFLKLLQARKTFLDDEHVKSWLIRVTINECKNIVRSSRWKEESIEEYAAKLAFVDTRESEMFMAVMDLSPKYRVPIYLHYYEGYSTKEIGQIMRIPKNTVCTRLNRGRQLLKKQFEEVDTDV